MYKYTCINIFLCIVNTGCLAIQEHDIQYKVYPYTRSTFRHLPFILSISRADRISIGAWVAVLETIDSDGADKFKNSVSSSRRSRGFGFEIVFEGNFDFEFGFAKLLATIWIRTVSGTKTTSATSSRPERCFDTRVSRFWNSLALIIL